MCNKEEAHDFKPEGIQVLAVDSNTVCLSYLVFLLKKCKYGVVGVKDGTEALEELRGNKGKFDIVITNVEQEDSAIDRFKLLEIIGHEMDIPVIMISADESRENVIRCIEHGARDYILKPVRVHQIKNIWQHVFRKKFMNSHQKIRSAVCCSSPSASVSVSVSASDYKKKKQRISWNAELHKKFVEAVEKLGNVVHPKKVLELMNEPGLTRDNVASHLQKFRNASRQQTAGHDLRSNRESLGFTLHSQNKLNRMLKTTMEETNLIDPLRPPPPEKLLKFQDLDFSDYVKNIQLPDECMIRYSDLAFKGYNSRIPTFYAQPSVFDSNPSSQTSMIGDCASETHSISGICSYQSPLPGQQAKRQEPLIDASIEPFIHGENSSYEKANIHSEKSKNLQSSGLQHLETISSCLSFDDDLQAIINPFIDSEPPRL